MNEVDVEIVNNGLELVELVQPALLFPPVELVTPVGDELRQIVELGAVVPVGALELIRESGPREPCPKILQHGIRNGNLKGSDSGRVHRSLLGDGILQWRIRLARRRRTPDGHNSDDDKMEFCYSAHGGLTSR